MLCTSLFKDLLIVFKDFTKTVNRLKNNLVMSESVPGFVDHFQSGDVDAQKALKIQARKISSLEESSDYQTTPQKPTPQLPKGIESGIWNKSNTKVIFLDKTDEKVKIYKKTGKVSTITVLTDIRSPLFFYWSNSEKEVIGITEKSLYLIGIENGSRKKENLSFYPSAVTWSPDDNIILLNDSNLNLYQKEKIGYNITTTVKYKIDLTQSHWVDKNRIISFEINEEKGKTTIFTYNIKEKKREIVTEKYAFPVSELRFDTEKQTAYLYHSTQKKWYEIKIF
jgi:hypothetical protein